MPLNYNSWTELSVVNIELPSSVLISLAATSHAARVLGEAVFAGWSLMTHAGTGRPEEGAPIGSPLSLSYGRRKQQYRIGGQQFRAEACHRQFQNKSVTQQLARVRTITSVPGHGKPS